MVKKTTFLSVSRGNTLKASHPDNYFSGFGPKLLRIAHPVNDYLPALLTINDDSQVLFGNFEKEKTKQSMKYIGPFYCLPDISPDLECYESFYENKQTNKQTNKQIKQNKQNKTNTNKKHENLVLSTFKLFNFKHYTCTCPFTTFPFTFPRNVKKR